MVVGKTGVLLHGRWSPMLLLLLLCMERLVLVAVHHQMSQLRRNADRSILAFRM